MGRRKKFVEVDFSSLEDIITYSYGKYIEIKTDEDYKNLIYKMMKQIKKDKLKMFREKHDCLYCADYELGICKETDFCRYDIK